MSDTSGAREGVLRARLKSWGESPRAMGHTPQTPGPAAWARQKAAFCHGPARRPPASQSRAYMRDSPRSPALSRTRSRYACARYNLWDCNAAIKRAFGPTLPR